MLSIIITEFEKLKRYHILLIGIIGMACSPILSLVTQSVAIDEAKVKSFDFLALFNSTIWNSATIFMPIIFTLIGGYLMNREYTDDTLKNILTVPVSFQKLLVGKLFAIGIFAGALGLYSFVITVIAGIAAGMSGLSIPVLVKGCFQTIGIAFCIYIAVLPIITITGRKQGIYMGGAIVAFILGYSSMFLKSGLARNIYPFLAAFSVIRFDTSVFMNTTGDADFLPGLISLCIMFFISVIIIWLSKSPDILQNKKKYKKAGIALRPAQRENNRTNQ